MPPTTLNSEEPQIHAPLDEEALAHLSADPTLDAPPRAAIWAMLMGLIVP